MTSPKATATPGLVPLQIVSEPVEQNDDRKAMHYQPNLKRYPDGATKFLRSITLAPIMS